MNLADKVAKANILAPYLNTTTIDLSRELTERGWDELSADSEFLRIFFERAFPCPCCGCWGLIDDDATGERVCEDCRDDSDDWYEE